MRKSRFTEEQQVAIVREADREDVAAVAKRHKITTQTIYIWKKKLGALLRGTGLRSGFGPP